MKNLSASPDRHLSSAPQERQAPENGIARLLDSVVTAALASIPGLSAASISLLDRAAESLDTAAATPVEIRRLDDIQYAGGAGPCVDASRDGQPITAVLPDDRWTSFSASALEAGIRSVLSMPLLTGPLVGEPALAGRECAGALNLYFHERGPWDDPTAGRVPLLAEQATAALIVSRALTDSLELNANLYNALESRTVIGQAQGILMARQRISSDEAFDVLRRASQRTNRKLRDIAAEIVAGATRHDHG